MAYLYAFEKAVFFERKKITNIFVFPIDKKTKIFYYGKAMPL